MSFCQRGAPRWPASSSPSQLRWSNTLFTLLCMLPGFPVSLASARCSPPPNSSPAPNNSPPYFNALKRKHISKWQTTRIFKYKWYLCHAPDTRITWCSSLMTLRVFLIFFERSCFFLHLRLKMIKFLQILFHLTPWWLPGPVWFPGLKFSPCQIECLDTN